MNAPQAETDLLGRQHHTGWAPAMGSGNRRPLSSIREGRHVDAPIGTSPAWREVVTRAAQVAPTEATTCLQGESGTGKEVIARFIHQRSPRWRGPFVAINCAALPEQLLESELFGFERGAFTGAQQSKPGQIELAAGGVLFLDEITEMTLAAQAKFLRVLQERKFRRVGGTEEVDADIRIIAATNTDLEEMVAQGRFREDLYYRLNVIRLRVPPLRERRSEIPTIVNYYLNHYSAKFGRRDIEITPQAIDLLMVSDWPGNVRQLCNEIQRIVARAEDGTILTPDQLSPELRRMSSPVSSQPSITPLSAVAVAPGQHITLADAIDELERRMIAEALRKHGGNISRAARELGLTRRGLYLKLERHDLSASA